MNSALKKILVVHIAGLSETTLALPAFRALNQHFPTAHISIVANATAADLLRLGNCADQILPIGRLRHELLRPSQFYRTLKVIRTIRQNAYDLAIELSHSSESASLLQIITANQRLMITNSSLQRGWRRLIENFAEKLTRRPAPLLHLAHQYLKRLEPLGVRPIEAEPRLTTDREADARIDDLLEKNGITLGELLIGVHAGAEQNQERWPLERFTSIATRVIHNFNARVLVFAGPDERGAAKRMVKNLPEKRAFELESLNIPDLVSAFARLSLLIANHSGPAHVAAAVGAPVVTISSLKLPSTLELLSKNHIHVRGPHTALIPEEEVYNAVCRMLKTSRTEYLKQSLR